MLRSQNVPKSLREHNRILDVPLLRRLVSSGKQNDDNTLMLRVIHRVSWTEVDLQLTDSICQNPVLALISVNKPFNADLNACPPGIDTPLRINHLGGVS